MNLIKIYLNLVIKNFRLMLSSKKILFSVFFGPLLILLIVSSAFHSTTLQRLNVGILKEADSQYFNTLINTMVEKKFNVIDYEDLEDCKSDVEVRAIDLCINFKFIEDNVMIKFFVDNSNIMLVEALNSLISASVEDSESGFRTNLFEQMLDKMAYFKQYVNDSYSLISGFESDLSNTRNKLSGITSTLSEFSLEFDKEKFDFASVSQELNSINFDELEDMNKQTHDTTANNLDQFKSLISQLKYESEKELKILEELESYAEDTKCKDLNIAELEEQIGFMTPSEARNLGKCACVSLFEDKINESKDGLVNIMGLYDDLNVVIDDSRKSSDATFYDLNNVISKRKDGLKQLLVQLESAETELDAIELEVRESEKSKKELETVLTQMSYDIGRKINDLRLVKQENIKTLNDFDDKYDLISSNSDVTLIRQLYPLAPKKDVFVYLFPAVFFFIIMFISILFSAGFILSEKRSKASFRNILSPVNQFIHISSAYISLFFVILVQSFIILFISDFFFDLNIIYHFPMVLFIELFSLSLFIILGMIVGFAINSELLATLFSVGISVVLFLFSPLLQPLQVMSEFAVLVARINPFYISTEVFRKLILFDTGMEHIIGDIFILAIELIVLVIVFSLMYKKSESKKH